MPATCNKMIFIRQSISCELCGAHFSAQPRISRFFSVNYVGP